ncbi:hypothetical protein DH2020_038261 [Rehmannia glutinosa]|uniref:Uncharacterized protein n=1 Tax=Rehmannia glutinosa TaxID=99300 RepID=A0ABR0UZ37_REHGL
MKTYGAIVEEGFVYRRETHLTVRKPPFSSSEMASPLLLQRQTRFPSRLVRPDSRDSTKLVLMDAIGRCILTVAARPSLHQRWDGFAGERTGKKPLFNVRRSSIIGQSSMVVEVYRNPGEEYQIEGSFGCRKCTIFNAKREVVAEIRRKVDAYSNVVLGKDVFQLSLKPGFDGAFAMGLVLILDQIHRADYEHN